MRCHFGNCRSFLRLARSVALNQSATQCAPALFPTDTNRFAAALGSPSRSKLANNEYPQSFIFAGTDVHTDVFDSHFADCVARVPAKPRLFIWHEWPDHPLIHNHAEVTDGEAIVAAEIKRTFSSDDFWAFINALRQGRRLLITERPRLRHRVRVFQRDQGRGKHPAVRRHVRSDAPSVKTRPNRGHGVIFHRACCAFRSVTTHGSSSSVSGNGKCGAGFPTLCHYGLSLLEAAVPVIEFPSA